MNVKPFPPVADLLPHEPPMIVVDEILDAGDGWLESVTTVTPEHVLFDRAENALPGWALIELMAQTIALYAGLDAATRNEPVCVGYLLGTRRFELRRTRFAPGEVLRVRAEREFDDPAGVSAFRCVTTDITGDTETVVVQARINVYQDSKGGFPS